MNKNEIDKIQLFIEEVNRLPDEILTEDDAAVFIANGDLELEQERVFKKQRMLFEKIKDLKIRLLAYFRVVTGETSTYIKSLHSITFVPKGVIYNTIHFENNRAWVKDKNTLLNLLKMAKLEFEEKVRFEKQKPEISIRQFLRTKEAKIVILTSILALITGLLTKGIWRDKSSSQSTDIKKYEIFQTDSLINSDKKKVLYQAPKEIFTDFYQTIVRLQKDYTAISAMSYIDKYLENEIPNINNKIENKSYVNRFADHQSLWKDVDFQEIRSLLKSKTVERINEIKDDVRIQYQGAFIITDDKLKFLKDLVKKEVDK